LIRRNFRLENMRITGGGSVGPVNIEGQSRPLREWRLLRSFFFCSDQELTELGMRLHPASERHTKSARYSNPARPDDRGRQGDAGQPRHRRHPKRAATRRLTGDALSVHPSRANRQYAGRLTVHAANGQDQRPDDSRRLALIAGRSSPAGRRAPAAAPCSKQRSHMLLRCRGRGARTPPAKPVSMRY
jgi:hypothetical protein